MGIQIATWWIWLIIYSFLGWVYESTLCSITGRRLVNRGFLNGPLCPIYGCGALAVILVLGKAADQSVFVLFLAGSVLTCTVEYITSWAMEQLFHTRWWDYSHYRFQLNGRVCLLGAIAFGTMSVLLLKVIHPWISGLVDRVPESVRMIVAFVLFVLVFLDTLVTVRTILTMNHKLEEIQAAINQAKEKYGDRLSSWKEDLADRAEEWKDTYTQRRQQFYERLEESEFYTDKIKKLLSQHSLRERRLLRAFPKMRPIGKSDALEDVKRWIEKKRLEKKNRR
jgi:uncharacterized membrane protein